jgi:hypothetical protein
LSNFAFHLPCPPSSCLFARDDRKMGDRKMLPLFRPEFFRFFPPSHDGFVRQRCRTKRPEKARFSSTKAFAIKDLRSRTPTRNQETCPATHLARAWISSSQVLFYQALIFSSRTLNSPAPVPDKFTDSSRKRIAKYFARMSYVVSICPDGVARCPGTTEPRH